MQHASSGNRIAIHPRRTIALQRQLQVRIAELDSCRNRMIDEITRLTNILDKLEKGSGTSMSVLHDECKSILSWVGNVNAAELPDSGEFIAIGLRLGAMAHALTQLFISQTRAVLGPNEAEMSDTSLH